MFRTAARCFGRRVIAVILSGGLDDGTDGARVIKRYGGIAIAQDPEEAIFSSMPQSAIRNVKVDHIAGVKEIASLLRKYVLEVVTEDITMCADLDERPDIAENGDKAIRNGIHLGPPSVMTCPDCGGALWEFQGGNQLRYRCHVGHLFTGDGLLNLKDDHLEQALWTAVRTMEEASVLRLRMADMAEKGRWGKMAPPYGEQARELRERADLIRERLLKEGVRKSKAKAARIKRTNGRARSARRADTQKD
jgi:two-component system chemotaxis response regulator CheB